MSVDVQEELQKNLQAVSNGTPSMMSERSILLRV